MTHVDPDIFFETQLWQSGLKYVAGLDEAGRGALAGPVSVGAVILSNDKTLLSSTLSGARDSKQMTPRERERLAIQIKEVALNWGVGFATAQEIDLQGIVRATRLAAIRALRKFSLSPQYLLTDFRLELPQLEISQTSLVKGDARCLSIACASILAKIERDALMRQLDLKHPGYGLGKHKGYGTQAHRSALKRMGPSKIHRRSFRVK
ncbi:MAG: ribonuclease HII [Chloroflexota bacterium]